MRIVRIIIQNFRCVREAIIYPSKHTVLLGPNNSGKTAILEALNLLLNPEISYRSHSIDENDFFNRIYIISPVDTVAGATAQPVVVSPGPASSPPPDGPASVLTPPATEAEESHQGSQPTAEASIGGIDQPKIYIEGVLTHLTSEDEDMFADYLVPWDTQTNEILERSDEGKDPFEGRLKAVRVFFEAWYDPEEDDFFYHTKFLRQDTDQHEECEDFTRAHKRHIGFLIYRDFRGLTRPITLEPTSLFGRLLQSQNVKPKNFEEVFKDIANVLSPIVGEADFISLLNSYKSEIERFVPLSQAETTAFSFDLTDRTRSVIKEEAQLYSKDVIYLPLQKSGAGTRSLAILSMLTLIMRRRGRGILALEEPETFLFPHAQRRVIDECLALASQVFVTTHSPYVLERLPVEGVGRVERESSGTVTWKPISIENVKRINLYSRRLKEVHCEALMGRGVVIVEGDSDRWWLLAASRILNRKVYNGNSQEAFELQGIAVVSADSNGDILKLAEFFKDAGLKVVGLYDQISDPGLLATIYSSEVPCLFLWGVGIEKILAHELPLDILRRLLTEAPHSIRPLLDSSAVGAMSEVDIRNGAFDKLKHEKGSASMHDWLINLLDDASLPQTLKKLVDTVSSYVSGKSQINTHSLCK